jgi:hypothetical protein
MKARHSSLTPKIVRLLEEDSRQKLAKALKINRTFLASYLLALENQSYAKSKRIEPNKMYSNIKNGEMEDGK